jgi:hypothetical protein
MDSILFFSRSLPQGSGNGAFTDIKKHKSSAGIVSRIISNTSLIHLLVMSSQHQKDKKEKDKKASPVCRVCKTNLPYKEHPPSGICGKCQTKIGVVFLIIMVILAGMVFVGLL